MEGEKRRGIMGEEGSALGTRDLTRNSAGCRVVLVVGVASPVDSEPRGGAAFHVGPAKGLRDSSLFDPVAVRETVGVFCARGPSSSSRAAACRPAPALLVRGPVVRLYGGLDEIFSQSAECGRRGP